MSTYKRNNEAADISGFTNCPGFLERYLAYRETFTNMRSGSIVDMFTVLREFCQYVHFKEKLGIEPSTKDAHKDMDISIMEIREVCDLTQDYLEQYLCFLETKVKNSSRTIGKKLNFIKKFYLYLERNAEELEVSLPHGNPARFLALPQTVVADPVTLTQKEVEKLLNGTTGENALRDKAFIMVLVTTGIQINELINLNRGDVLEDELLIRSDKGDRKVFLTDACAATLNRYLRGTAEYDQPYHPLFLAAATGTRLTARSVQLRIEKAAGVAGLSEKNITARTLRNTAAAMLFRASEEGSYADVRKYLGCTSRASMRKIINAAAPSKIGRNDLLAAGLGDIGKH